MASPHIVVDGSNIATEGRSAPSLAQLEDAVAELKREHPDAEVTVIVDATFSHRIDQSELDRFERAVLAGEYVHPPAGAIGRGDAFLLRVAEKVDGTVLSNDSFQEFHGEHPWLFERGRLLGATPVPGIGWIFSPRSPVRGPTSRKAVRDTEKAKRQVTKAIKVATKEAVAPAAGGAKPKIGDRRVPRRVSEVGPLKTAPQAPASATVNDPLTFVSFIAEHPLGAEIKGRVESYTSHGAVVMVGNTQCYVPLANLRHPAPRSAREVLKRGEEVTFVVRALDPQRRGVELALPGVADVSGKPSAEMIQAEMQLARKRQPAAKKAAVAGRASTPAAKAALPARKARSGARKASALPAASEIPALPAEEESPGVTGPRTSPRRAVAAKKAAAAKKAVSSERSPATPAVKVPTPKTTATRKAAARARATTSAEKAPGPAKAGGGAGAKRPAKSTSPARPPSPQPARSTSAAKSTSRSASPVTSPAKSTSPARPPSPPRAKPASPTKSPSPAASRVESSAKAPAGPRKRPATTKQASTASATKATRTRKIPGR